MTINWNVNMIMRCTDFEKVLKMMKIWHFSKYSSRWYVSIDFTFNDGSILTISLLGIRPLAASKYSICLAMESFFVTMKILGFWLAALLLSTDSKWTSSYALRSNGFWSISISFRISIKRNFVRMKSITFSWSIKKE